MTATDVDVAMTTLRPWIGSVRVIEDDIALPMARRVAATFDVDPDSIKPGSELPPHWFTMFFADIARQGQLREDGHAQGGVVLPPIPMPRRTGAGRRLKLMARLRAGEKAVRKSEVVDIVPKTGRSTPTSRAAACWASTSSTRSIARRRRPARRPPRPCQ
jgi:3-methylfumaryl-CoA hydratase